MTVALIKPNTGIQPSSFDATDRKLTTGQKMLIELLSQKIKDKQPIKQRDIVDLYFKIFSKDGVWITVYFYFKHDVDKNNYYAKAKALSWFKSNLGSCIIKGKLLAIPIIEIE